MVARPVDEARAREHLRLFSGYCNLAEVRLEDPAIGIGEDGSIGFDWRHDGRRLAVTFEEAGGTVTDDVIRSLAISQRLLGTTEIMLIHHTDCGMQKTTEDAFKGALEAETGIRPPWAVEAFTDADRRDGMKQSANIFRVLIKTLLNAGIITERTKAFYGMYVDMDELKNEGDRMVGDDIAEEGIKYLQTINFADRSNGTKLLAAE